MTTLSASALHRHLISMDDLTKEEKAEAATQNWGLFQIYDLVKAQWKMNVLPIEFKTGRGAVQALDHVVAQARFGNPLSLKALRVMGAYNAGKKK